MAGVRLAMGDTLLTIYYRKVAKSSSNGIFIDPNYNVKASQLNLDSLVFHPESTSHLNAIIGNLNNVIADTNVIYGSVCIIGSIDFNSRLLLDKFCEKYGMTIKMQ